MAYYPATVGECSSAIGSVSDACDNAFVERCIAGIKTELPYKRSRPAGEPAGVAVFEYIETFRNPGRRDSALG